MSEQQYTEPPYEPQDDGVAPPPRFLLWLVIGLFVLGILGVIGGIVVFRQVLLPAQQQRVIDQLPFMQVFKQPTPQGGAIPTAIPVESDISADDLLAGLPLLGEPEATEDPTAEAEVIVTVEPPTATPTIAIQPSNTPDFTATPLPTAEPTAEPTLAPTQENVSLPANEGAEVRVSIPNRPATHTLGGITYVEQGWNNCGPANITMGLSYYGWTDSQTVAANYLKPNREDKNVSPHELVSFVNERSGVRAITRIGGDTTLLRNLIASNFPVIIETGYMPEGNDWMGHYLTVFGYDDMQGVFYLYDSNLKTSTGVTETYDNVDRFWQHFNRTFIVIYEQNREAELTRLLGPLADPITAAEHALEVARQEANADRRNVFAWFNMGTAYTYLGQYTEATTAFDQSRREGQLPWRMTWYQFYPFEAYFEAGRYDDVMALVNINLANTPYVEETYYWQGRVAEAQGNTQEARQAYQRALNYNSRYEAARAALDALSS